MESIMKTLSFEERHAIEELQSRLKNSLTPKLSSDPTLFYRFLKARDFDVNKAEEMLKNHISWRKAFQVDTILDWFEPQKVFELVGMDLIGNDKYGNVVRYAPSGRIDVRDFIKVMKLNDYMKHWIWLAEKDIARKKQNNNVQSDAFQAITIFNLDGFAFSNAVHKSSSEFLLRLTYLLQDNYPERMKALYVINAPMYFTFLFSIVRKVMSNAMLNKIHIYGQHGWREALLDIIDENVLPAFLGGNRTDSDGDPYCKSFIHHGGKIHSKYYLSDKERYFQDPSRVKKVVVPHNEKCRIKTEVSEVGSLIYWEFELKNKDIGFGLEYQSPNSQPKELLPVQKILTIDGTERGFFEAQKTGTYFIVFENSGSRWSSKEVHYCITIKPAKLRNKDCS